MHQTKKNPKGRYTPFWKTFLTLFLALAVACSSAPMRADIQGADEDLVLRDDVSGFAEEEMLREESEAFAGSSVDEPAPSTAVLERRSAEEAPGAERGVPEDKGPEILPPERLTTDLSPSLKLPQLLSRIEGPDQSPLPLVSQDVAVYVSGYRARVILDLVFENPTSQQLSGNFFVGLPQGASPAFLGMYETTLERKEMTYWDPRGAGLEGALAPDLGLRNYWEQDGEQVNWGELRPARVVSPQRGRQVYEQVTRRRVDPALSEWTGGNKFTARIFPIDPMGVKRIVFAYDRPLLEDAGNWSMVLPLGETEDVLTRLTVQVDPRMTNVSLYQGKESLEFRANGKYQEQVEVQEGDLFQLSGTFPREDLQALVGTSPTIDGVLARVRVKVNPPVSESQRDTGQAVFLVDTSYSGKETLFRRSGQMLRAILEKDPSITEFRIISFDVRAREVTQGFQANTPANRERVLQQVERIWLEGATNLEGALEFLKADTALAQADSFFLLSDGVLTWGNERLTILSQAFAELWEQNWYCYAFGDETINRNLFTQLTNNGGQLIRVPTGASDLSQAAVAHRQSPVVLEDVRLNRGDFQVVGEPKTIYPGQTLEVLIRLPEEAQNLRLEIVAAGETQAFNFGLAVPREFPRFGSRAWAEGYANLLLSLEDPESDQMSLALSQHFGLVNRNASFLILETDAEFEAFDLQRESLEWADVVNKIQGKKGAFRPGAPIREGLAQETLEAIEGLRQVKATFWRGMTPRIISQGNIMQAWERDQDFPRVLYLQAKEALESDPEAALRILSTMIEINPADDTSLRTVGFVLMEWQLYKEAEAIFARLRQRRPFEPQNYMLEALALTAQGRIAEAALNYEVVLQENFQRFDGYAKDTARFLYQDLLMEAAKRVSGNLGQKLRQRVRSIGGEQGWEGGRLLMFWNLDDTDVDLHIQESKDERVSYQYTNSSTGGKLYWDNTQGLGPEIYSHPNISKAGFRVETHYFGSNSVEGAAPAATLVGVMDREKDQIRMRFFSTLLLESGGEYIPVMPIWQTVLN
jgi:tetratricopeptide (TPR) repeat protein